MNHSATKPRQQSSFLWLLRFLLGSLGLLVGCVVMRILQSNEMELATTAKTIDQPLEQSQKNNVFSFLPSTQLQERYDWVLRHSDVVTLDHCTINMDRWTQFTQWVEPLWNQSIVARLDGSGNTSTTTATTIQQQRDEWMLEFLEIYATHRVGWCNFSQYHPQPKNTLQDAGRQLLQVQQEYQRPPGFARLAFTIVAFKDVLQLQRLIQAIHMPHHFIVIHLDRHADQTFQTNVSEFSQTYHNVVVVQFGTIVYRTDSVSQVTWQLMEWMTNTLGLDYDYHISLGGATYPLLGSQALAQYLWNSSGSVWLGALTHNGRRVDRYQWDYVARKRLQSTIIQESAKSASMPPTIKLGFTFDTDFDFFRNTTDNNVLERIQQEALLYKSVSGNQAIFSQSLIRQMLSKPEVLQLEALAKYGCCCCLEERTWIAMMQLLGHLQQAQENTAMYQLWGGKGSQCRGTTKNAILDTDPSRCFRNEYIQLPANTTARGSGGNYLTGNDLWDHLVQAKQHGFLFARKFVSGHEGSMRLLERIQRELHYDNVVM